MADLFIELQLALRPGPHYLAVSLTLSSHLPITLDLAPPHTAPPIRRRSRSRHCFVHV
jgi:hypothetical protein